MSKSIMEAFLFSLQPLGQNRDPDPSAPCATSCAAHSTDGIWSKGGKQSEDLNQENRNLNLFWKLSIPLIPRTMEACRTFLVSVHG
jgi:hypothetical protein